MIKVKICILIILLFNIPVFSSPLIYKGTIDISEGLINETPLIDTVKYKQLRILVRRQEKPNSISDVFFTNLYTFESEKEYLVIASKENLTEYSTIVDTPPSKIKIKISGKGNFDVLIWAS